MQDQSEQQLNPDVEQIVEILQEQSHKNNEKDKELLQNLLIKNMKRLENMTIKSQYGNNILDNYVDLIEVSKYKKGDFIYHIRQLCDYVYFVLDGDVMVWEKKEDSDFNAEQELLTKVKQQTNRLKMSENIREQEYIQNKINELNRKLLKYRIPDQDKTLKKQEHTHNNQYFTLPNISHYKCSKILQKGDIVGETEAVSELRFEKSFQVQSGNCLLLKMNAGAFVRVFDLQVKKVKFIQNILRNNLPEAKQESIELLSYNAEDEIFYNGVSIFDEEDRINKMYIVREGRVNISKMVVFNNEQCSVLQQKTVKGSKNLEVYHITDGQCFGFENLIQRYGQKPKKREYKARATAIDITWVFSISKKLLNKIIQENDDFKLQENIYQLSDMKLNWINQRISKLINFSTRQFTQERFRKRSIKMQQLEELNLMMSSSSNKNPNMNYSKQQSMGNSSKSPLKLSKTNSNNNNMQSSKSELNSPGKKTKKSLLVSHFINQIHNHIKEEDELIQSSQSMSSFQSESSSEEEQKVVNMSPLKKRATQIIPNFESMGLVREESEKLYIHEEDQDVNMRNMINMSQIGENNNKNNNSNNYNNYNNNDSPLQSMQDQNYFRTYRKSMTLQNLDGVSPIRKKGVMSGIGDSMLRLNSIENLDNIESSQNLDSSNVPKMNIFSSSNIVASSASPRKTNFKNKTTLVTKCQSEFMQNNNLGGTPNNINNNTSPSTQVSQFNTLYNSTEVQGQHMSQNEGKGMSKFKIQLQNIQDGQQKSDQFVGSQMENQKQEQLQQQILTDREQQIKIQQEQKYQQKQQLLNAQQLSYKNKRDNLKNYTKNSAQKGQIINYMHLIDGMVQVENTYSQKVKNSEVVLNMIPQKDFEKRQKFEKAKVMKLNQDIKWQKSTLQLSQKLLHQYKEKQKKSNILQFQQSQKNNNWDEQGYLTYYQQCQTEPDLSSTNRQSKQQQQQDTNINFQKYDQIQSNQKPNYFDKYNSSNKKNLSMEKLGPVQPSGKKNKQSYSMSNINLSKNQLYKMQLTSANTSIQKHPSLSTNRKNKNKNSINLSKIDTLNNSKGEQQQQNTQRVYFNNNIQKQQSQKKGSCFTDRNMSGPCLLSGRHKSEMIKVDLQQKQEQQNKQQQKLGDRKGTLGDLDFSISAIRRNMDSARDQVFSQTARNFGGGAGGGSSKSPYKFKGLCQMQQGPKVNNENTCEQMCVSPYLTLKKTQSQQPSQDQNQKQQYQHFQSQQQSGYIMNFNNQYKYSN